MHMHEGHPGNSENQASGDIQTLKVLLAHWIEHNKSHEENFRKWAEKAKNLGKDECGEYIKKAADLLLKASEALFEAKKYI
ncbi:hypothetical protein [Thermovenabulum sp.]|uniref:hypothetical protein n=1 Tax=Thermovenabulum sp. TaxID=3100335 RepID=UPI003C79A83F